MRMRKTPTGIKITPFLHDYKVKVRKNDFDDLSNKNAVRKTAREVLQRRGAETLGLPDLAALVFLIQGKFPRNPYISGLEKMPRMDDFKEGMSLDQIGKKVAGILDQREEKTLFPNTISLYALLRHAGYIKNQEIFIRSQFIRRFYSRLGKAAGSELILSLEEDNIHRFFNALPDGNYNWLIRDLNNDALVHFYNNLGWTQRKKLHSDLTVESQNKIYSLLLAEDLHFFINIVLKPKDRLEFFRGLDQENQLKFLGMHREEDQIDFFRLLDENGRKAFLNEAGVKIPINSGLVEKFNSNDLHLIIKDLGELGLSLKIKYLYFETDVDRAKRATQLNGLSVEDLSAIYSSISWDKKMTNTFISILNRDPLRELIRELNLNTKDFKEFFSHLYKEVRDSVFDVLTDSDKIKYVKVISEVDPGYQSQMRDHLTKAEQREIEIERLRPKFPPNKRPQTIVGALRLLGVTPEDAGKISESEKNAGIKKYRELTRLFQDGFGLGTTEKEVGEVVKLLNYLYAILTDKVDVHGDFRSQPGQPES